MDVHPYSSDASNVSHSYLFPAVAKVLERYPARRVFEVGCGNGSFAKALEAKGFEVTGVDPSDSGIAFASHPRLRVGSAYDDLATEYGTFPIVLSLEVVEHCYSPKAFAKTVFELVEPGGVAIISTPFHGYWKNVALAISGKMDSHFTALWEGGHIKFWSENTLGRLLRDAGFDPVEFERVGRIGALAKSFIAVAHRPK